MRRVLFAIAFFFVQYVSGVAIRYGVTKDLNDTLIVPTEKSLINSTSLDKSNKIDEKEILENGDDKPNNLSERSFVWINTRFKSPLRSNIYNSEIDEWKLDNLYQFKKSLHNDRPLSPSPKSSISLMVRHPESPSTHQGHPSAPIPPTALFRPHQNIRIPCSMPHKHLNQKTSNKCNQGYSKPFIHQKFRQELPKMIPHLHNIVNEPKHKPYDHVIPKIPHILNPITRSKVKETYGFPSLYQAHRTTFDNDELGYKPEDLNQEGNLFTDSSLVLSPVSDSDEDRLLEKYIKHTLADNGVRLLDHELHKKCKDCNNGKLGKNDPNCKCETDAPEIKNKFYQLIKKKTKHSFLESTTESKNKMNEYDDSSNVETFLNATMADVLFTSNTINELVH